MSVRFAVISDLHFSRSPSELPARRGEFAALLLRRAVEYLNLRTDIDLLCLAGDLLDNPADVELLAELKAVLDHARLPLLVIPGNHDPEPELFYQTMPRADYFDAGARARFIPFVDPELPGCHARRLPAELARAERLSAEFAGPKIFLQHVPLYPPGRADNRYGYANADEIVGPMRRLGVAASISGHQHEGCRTLPDEGVSFCCLPALCEAPFAFRIYTLSDAGRLDEETIALQLPAGRRWSDFHTHSPFAYCNENIDYHLERQLMDLLHLDRVAVTEHSSHLFYPREEYLKRQWFEHGMPPPGPADRSGDYLTYLDRITAADSRFRRGTELDIAGDGSFLINRALQRGTELRLGAVHALPDAAAPDAPAHFLKLAERLIAAGGIQVLAHPFRVFSWNGVGRKPAELFAPLVKLLKEHQVAAEVNFHCNRPDPDFTRQCIDAGVKISLGSDTHNLYELGFFNPHLDFLRAIGYDGDWDDILFDPGN
ncbi:metallophosphoesterase [Victivallis sp. Marseille-Q1083]|uniref:metallophosphoesterase n=1 Tax=Victivallis sp. Marseille-Q1083 TaxID=2717288 RepID=UPI00158EE07D|nr:metallophosphoesterase [Victivallis sp. Marseille-Q1083]